MFETEEVNAVGTNEATSFGCCKNKLDFTVNALMVWECFVRVVYFVLNVVLIVVIQSNAERFVTHLKNDNIVKNNYSQTIVWHEMLQTRSWENRRTIN